MLERSSLWLSPLTSAWPPGLPAVAPLLRHVLSTDNREILGHVAVIPGRWWPWPSAAEVAAFEAPDASLIFRARSMGWLRRVILVAEADGNPVGYVYDNRIVRPGGGLIALRRPGVAEGIFVGSAGRRIAEWQAASGGVTVNFPEGSRNEPFTKMGILAAILMGA
jgi:hypothetical protein